MNNTLKKTVAIITAITCAVWMMGPGVAQALTAEELQEQIDTLLVTIATLQAQIAGLEGEAVVTIEGVPADFTFETNLKLASTGDDVKYLQIVLNSASDTQLAASGVGSAGEETSYFGPLTKAAVIKFQEKYTDEVLASYGLTEGTGFVGSTTRAKLNSLLAAAEEEEAVCSVITDAVECVTADCSWNATTEICSGVAEEEEEEVCSEITGAVECVTAGCSWNATTEICSGVIEEEEIGDPLTVSLTSDTPVGTLLLAGSANNTVTKVTFFGAADTATTITGLTIKSYGTANLAAADIARIKVFDGTTQIGLTQIQVNGISTFTFAPAISIAAGSSKTLSIAVDIAATGVATPSATVKMGIEVATSIMGSTFTGTFPIVGNFFTIVAGGAIGVVNVTAGSPVPYNLITIGTKDLPLGNFIVTAGTNEDIEITQFNATYGGAANTSTCQDSDVTNVRVKVDGVLTGTSAGFATRRATIDFTTPITITKGTSKIFQVIGDIVGAGRIIELSCEAGSIFGLGAVSGAGVSGPAARFNLGAVNAITFGPGNLAVSVSTVSPAGSGANVVVSITPQILGVYDVRAVGENVLINTVNLQLVEATGAVGAGETIANVGLYNEDGALLSNQITYVQGDLNTPNTNAFALNWLVSGNTTQRLYVKGTTNALTPPAGGYVINARLALVTAVSIVGTGMSSSGQAGPNNITSTSALGLPALTVNATATFLAVADPTKSVYDQAFVAPAAQAALGYLKITAQREDQDYRALILTATVTGTAANLAALASGVALFEGTTQITQFVAPGFDANASGAIAAGEWNLVRFATTDTITPVTFTIGTPKTFTIAANLLTQASEDNDVTWNVMPVTTAGALDTGLQTLGRQSGVVASNGATTIALRTNVGAFNATGTYDLRTNVLEVKTAAISPTGSVRGTFQSHGIWDLETTGSAANLDVSAITFTSTVGLPATATAAMFRLFNYTNGAVIPATVTVTPANGTVAFTGIAAGNCRVTAGSTLQIALQATTTDTTVWLINSQIQWGILTQATVTVGAMGTAVAATDADFLDALNVANILVAPQVTNVLGSVLTSAPAFAGVPVNGAVFAAGQGLYLKGATVGAAAPVATVAAGDTRLILSTAAIAAGFTVNSVVAVGDGDLAVAGLAAPQVTDVVGSILKSGGAGGAALGTDGVYRKVGAAAGAVFDIQATDVRVAAGNAIVEGLNWQGDVGYGGVTVSLPSIAPTVLLP